jgi:uncharacterized coiled-coil DUF342 family protein
MPAVDRDRDKPSALGLEEHLGQYYGIGGLRNAAEQLKAKRKAIEARIKRLKNANSSSAQRFAQLQTQIEDTARRAEEAAEGHKAIQDRARKARERDRLDADIKKWEDKHSAWAASVKRLAARVSSDLGRTVAVGSVERALDERLVRLDPMPLR